MKITLLIILLVTLVGCGGGGTSNNEQSPTSPSSIKPSKPRIELNSGEYGAIDSSFSFLVLNAGDYEKKWSFSLQPEGSMAQITHKEDNYFEFIPKKKGTYLIELVLDNNGVLSDPVTKEVIIGTPVSGVYRDSQTLSKDKSPYYVKGNADIAGDLIIEPGVTILSSERSAQQIDSFTSLIEVRGKISAIGNAENPIRFDGVSLYMKEFIGDYIDFQNGELTRYRAGFTKTEKLSLTNSTVSSKQLINVHGPATYHKNIFNKSSGIIIDFPTVVTNNLFYGKDPDLHHVYSAAAIKFDLIRADNIAVSEYIFKGNSFYQSNDEREYTIEVDPAYEYTGEIYIMDFSGNYWDTMNDEEIASTIYDSEDNLNNEVTIYVPSTLSAPHPETPDVEHYLD